MQELYHFSHFLEFLCGVYFGGFALLGFIEEDALVQFKSLIIVRAAKANTSKILQEEYFKVRTTSPKDGKLNFMFFGSCWIAYSFLDMLFSNMFAIANYFINKVGSSEDKQFLKKFFPSFFFAGCFCLVVILLSAFQAENVDNDWHKSINHFVIYYGVSCLIFQFWSLVFFPSLVNRIDYFHLTLINIVLCCALGILSFSFAKDQILYLNLGGLLEHHNHAFLNILIVFIALIPLLYIIGISILTIIFWELSVLFFNFSIFIFGRNNDIDDVIKEISE